MGIKLIFTKFHKIRVCKMLAVIIFAVKGLFMYSNFLFHTLMIIMKYLLFLIFNNGPQFVKITKIKYNYNYISEDNGLNIIIFMLNIILICSCEKHSHAKHSHAPCINTKCNHFTTQSISGLWYTKDYVGPCILFGNFFGNNI